MINYELVAKKINDILNGTDSEVITLGLTNPTDLHFMVETQGFHLDHIMDKNIGVNVIPVFISAMGGQMNPVPELKQGNYTIPITFYFPIRFKDKMFVLNEFLADVFVGRILNYGGAKCVSNISVPQFGEIQGLDLKEFITWEENVYQRELETKNEPFISMSITLYLSNAKAGFVYGNDVLATISIDDSSLETAIENVPITFAEGSLGAAMQSVNEQEVNTGESVGLPLGSSYGSGFSVYYEENALFNYIMDKWFAEDSDIQSIRFTLDVSIGSKTLSRYCYIDSISLPIKKGELLVVTFAFSKALAVEDENNG